MEILNDLATLIDKGISLLDIAILIASAVLLLLSGKNARQVGFMKPSAIPNRFVQSIKNIPNYPTPEAMANLIAVTMPNFNALENALFGAGTIPTPQLQIVTAYRSPEVNEAATGIKDSLHLVGLAVDFSCPNPAAWLPVINSIIKTGVCGSVRELIIYPDYHMIHIAWYPEGKGGPVGFYSKDVAGNITRLQEYA